DETVVGIYWFAYMLSLQSVMLLSNTLSQVLLPALSQLNDDPDRQREAFLRAARMLAGAGVFICLLQAACAAPAVRLLLPVEQAPIIPVIQILSIGMAIRIGWTASRNLILAQGRFRTYFGLVILYTGIFIAAAMTAVQIATPETAGVAMAVAVACFCIFVGPFDLWMAIRAVGGRWRHVARVFGAPVSAAILALLGPLVIDLLLLPSPGGASASTATETATGVEGVSTIRIFADVARLAIYSVGGGVLYVVLIRRFEPSVWREFRSRLVNLRSRK
ncbi:MAG: oligosaccharide flippase family protein, partial [Planctomycetota bacterium]